MTNVKIPERWARRGNQRTDAVKIAMVGIAIVGLLGLGAWAWFLGRRAYRPIDADLCPTEQAPSSVTVVLLDISDELTEQQRLRIGNELERIQNEVQRFGLIEVYTVNQDQENVVRAVVRLCSPGSEDVSVWYQNPGMAKK